MPGPLGDNPSLDRWVAFPSPGKVTIFTGRVEFGQGMLTAMAQVAADELDVAIARIAVTSGDTALTPNEGYTAGSMSMQFGGVALAQACAEVRALFLAQAAKVIGCAASELSIGDGKFLRGGKTTGQDYWTLAAAVDLAVKANGVAKRKAVTELKTVGLSQARLDLPAKVFGRAAFIHDMQLDGMRHARVVRQPNRGATLAAVDEAAIKRAAKSPIEFVRSGNFLAILGDDEAALDTAASAAANHVTWQNVEKPAPLQQEASWLLQRPSIDRVIGAPEPTDAQGRERFEATYTKPHIAHASVSPSCGLALYNDGHLTVWTHCQGVFPLRDALARTLRLDASAITVHHVQGAGCYGHNGADDAAADAAVIACERPGVPVRVRWRREEEFVYEPKAPAMVVKVRALVGSDGKPSDWTAEIWSGTHAGRPGHGNPVLADEALPDPLPLPPPSDVPEAGGGGATRNAEPLYDIAAKRIVHHLVPETPVRVSSLRGLGAMSNVFALECAIDELAERAGQDPVAYRLSITTDPRARAVIEKAAAMAKWDSKDAAWRPPAPAPGVALPFRATRTAPATPPWWSSSMWTKTYASVTSGAPPMRAWWSIPTASSTSSKAASSSRRAGCSRSKCASMTACSSVDWLTYPVLKFSEVPEIDIALINTRDSVPLGVGEVTAGPTAAAIGNAVSHALGARIRDLPLTRERVMAALLTT